MSWCSDATEDEAISLFVGLLANPDVPLSPQLLATMPHRHYIGHSCRSSFALNYVILANKSLVILPNVLYGRALVTTKALS